MLDLSDVMPGETGGGISEGLAIGAWRRVWRVSQGHALKSLRAYFLNSSVTLSPDWLVAYVIVGGFL